MINKTNKKIKMRRKMIKKQKRHFYQIKENKMRKINRKKIRRQ